MSDFPRAFLDLSRAYLKGDYLPRIEKAVERLSEKDFWWRPNEASNSAGNLVVHLAGNVRQWIVHGLGGETDVRDRDSEFSVEGGISKEEALDQLRAAVDEACAVLERIEADALWATYTPQAHEVTGLEAVYHVVEHFSMHTGQIVWIVKERTGKPLGFYDERPGGLARLAWMPTPEGPRPS